MDSRRTGSNELLFIQTDKVSVSIKGQVDQIERLKRNNRTNQSELKVYCVESFQATLYPNWQEDVEADSKNSAALMMHYDPLFFEQERYELVIESKDETKYKIEFWHDNLNIRNKVTPTGRRQAVLSGILHFGNEIGMTDLIIRVNCKNHLRVVLEIFPSKIDYKEDYQALLHDVTSEIYSLVFDFWRKTYQNYAQTDRYQSSTVEFFAVIRTIFDDFIRAADIIVARPHHVLETIRKILPSHKVKHIDKRSIRWLEKHPQQIHRSTNSFQAIKTSAIRKQVTFNTKENRFVKTILTIVIRKLAEFRRLYKKLPREQDHYILDVIDTMSTALDRRLNATFLKDVPTDQKNQTISLVFSMAPGYRELYKCFLMLMRGLSISGDVFSISVKDIALLYEYWCFIKLNRILKGKYELVSQDVIKTQQIGLFVSLVKGTESRVRYRHPDTGELIVLSYNPHLTRLPTISQRPDHVLKLEKQGSEHEYEYIFDAKYRINPALPGTNYHLSVAQTPGPEIDDINTMHRYRDAIMCNSQVAYERRMFGAYVLFPYQNENEYRTHRFWKSIDSVNIGGIPFLPSATGMVEEMLDDLIQDSADSAFARASLPRGSYEKLLKVDWDQRDVLVIAVKDEEELNLFLKDKSCKVKLNELNVQNFPLRYVALYQSKKSFGLSSGIYLVGEVQYITPFQVQSDALATSMDDSASIEIRVSRWKTLDQPIHAKEIGFHHFMTNEFLLSHALAVPQLLIRSEAEYKLFAELSRAVDKWQIDPVGDNIRFRLDDIVIFIEDGFIFVMLSAKIIGKYSVNEFISRPNATIRAIHKLKSFNQPQAN